MGHLTREADDRVMVSRMRREAEPARQAVTPSLTQRKRTVPPTKTGLVDVTRAGGELRGCHCHPGSARNSGQRLPRRGPGPNAMHAIRSHLREQTARRGVRDPMAAIVAPLDPDVSGAGPLGEITCGAMATGTRAAGRSSRPTPGPVPPAWTRLLLRARPMRHATLNASGRRVSDSRLREHRTDGLTWRGLEPWPRWHGEPTLPSQEQDWTPSTSSRRASPRPYQATAASVRMLTHGKNTLRMQRSVIDP